MLYIRSDIGRGGKFAGAFLLGNFVRGGRRNIKNLWGNSFLLLSGAFGLLACQSTGGGGSGTASSAGSNSSGSFLITAMQASPAMDEFIGTMQNGFAAGVPSTESSELIVDLSEDSPVGVGGYFQDDIFIGMRNLIGGNGVNRFTGDSGDNEFIGGRGSNIFVGNGGSDILRGGASNDELYGGTGNDHLDGGGGDDILRGGAGADVLIGGIGDNDIAIYSDSNLPVTASLSNPGVNTNDAAGDSYVGIEDLQGSDHADTLIGDGGSNILIGGGGFDALFGGGGSDWASYSSASRGVTASLSDSSVNMGRDSRGDTYDSIENLKGSDYNDVLIGDSGDNILLGKGGSDTLRGEGGDDFLIAGSGDDHLYGGVGSDTFCIGVGNQIIFDFSLPSSSASGSVSVVDMLDFSQLPHLSLGDIRVVSRSLSITPANASDYVLEYRFDGNDDGIEDSSVIIMTAMGSVDDMMSMSNDILSFATMFADV